MSGSWEAMLDDERRQSDLARRRELARLSKVELIDLVLTTEHEIRARAVRETAAYIDRIHKNGLVPLGTVLADMESAAWRMEQGMTARGNMRTPRADVEIGR